MASCPKCMSKLTKSKDGVWSCRRHGQKKGKK